MGSSEKTDGFFIRNKSVLVLGLVALIIAALADLIAGLFLTGMQDYLLTIPGMMILIYCAIGMRGNIFGAVGSRLGTSMHLGTFQLTLKKRSVLRSNIEAAMALTLILSFLMGIAGCAVTEIFSGTLGHPDPMRFIFISVVGGTMSSIVVLFFNIIIAYVGFKQDWDVDNITAPLIAAIGDIVTVPMILVTVILEQEHLNDITVTAVCGILAVITVLMTALILMRKNRRRKRIDEAKRIVKQSLPVLCVCMVFEIGAGFIIQNETDKLVSFAVLLVLLPAFLNEGNALSGMLTSRLSSMIHLGTLEPKLYPKKEAVENFIVMYILATITFFIIGNAAYLVTEHTLDYPVVIAIVMVAGLLTTTVINVLSYFVAILATKFDLDPDDHCIPITSSLMDVIGTAILIFTVWLLIV